MNMLKNEGEIRKRARNTFAGHVAKLKVNDNNMVVIDWSDKESSLLYNIQFVIDKARGVLCIYGDYGCCISSWGNELTVKNLVNYVQNIVYWVGKFMAASDMYSYNINDVKADLLELKEYYLSIAEDLDKSVDEINENFDDILIYFEDEWVAGEYYPADAVEIIEEYEPDWSESSWATVGRKVNDRVFIWSEGLRMAYEQLKEVLDV